MTCPAAMSSDACCRDLASPRRTSSASSRRRVTIGLDQRRTQRVVDTDQHRVAVPLRCGSLVQLSLQVLQSRHFSPVAFFAGTFLVVAFFAAACLVAGFLAGAFFAAAFLAGAFLVVTRFVTAALLASDFLGCGAGPVAVRGVAAPAAERAASAAAFDALTAVSVASAAACPAAFVAAGTADVAVDTARFAAAEAWSPR